MEPKTNLPASPSDTAKALFNLLDKGYFYEVIAFSLFRVLLGLFLGIVVAAALSYIPPTYP